MTQFGLFVEKDNLNRERFLAARRAFEQGLNRRDDVSKLKCNFNFRLGSWFVFARA